MSKKTIEVVPVRHGMIDYRVLEPLQPETYKKLSSEAFKKMLNAISTKGFRVPIQVWESPEDSKVYILDGHQRRTFLMNCQDKKIPLVVGGVETYEVPVVYIYAQDKRDAAEMLLSIDSEYGERSAEGILDFMKLYEIETAWMDDFVKFNDVGDSFEDLVNSLDDEAVAKEDDEYEVPDVVNTQIVVGDLFQIGPHRLLCGDSTSPEAWERLMDGERLDLVVTDPPYNVNYEGKTKDKLKIQNDNMGSEAFFEFLFDFYTAIGQVTKPGGVYYIWHADSEGHNFRKAFIDAGNKLAQTIIWKKNSMVMGRQDYQWQHEPCLYGWKEGAGHHWYSDRKQTTILEFDKPVRNDKHPTMKPVPLISYQVNNSSQRGDKVGDGFLGSGTTMVSSHKLQRTCYGMELDPKFCHVIIERMMELDPDIVVLRNGEPITLADICIDVKVAA